MAQCDHIQVAAFEPRSSVNGPGIRAVLWVQGCHRRCPGCFNQACLPFSGASEQTVDQVYDRILACDSITGVSFSGGEPFEQAASLAKLARQCRIAGLGVLVFTGYTLDDLHSPAHQALLDQTDLLVAGPYEKDKPQQHSLLASANQTLHFLTDRYRDSIPSHTPRRAEFHIAPDGTIRKTGFPPASQ